MPDLVRCIHGFAVTSESGYCTACLISELQRQLAAANERADKFEAFFAGLWHSRRNTASHTLPGMPTKSS